MVNCIQIISQLVQNNNSQILDIEKTRHSVKKPSVNYIAKKSFDIFEIHRKTSKVPNIGMEHLKYSEVWKRVRIKIKEKLARRYYKELELYDSCTVPDFEGRLRRINSVLNEFKGTSAEISQKPFYIIHPKSSLKKCWNFLMIFILLYTATVMPYRIAFTESDLYDFWFFLDNILNFLFFVDFMFNCFTAFYDNSNILVTHLPTILVQYLKGWFLIDLCGCIPLDLILKGNGNNYNNLLRLLRLPRLYRLCKLSKIFKYIKSKQGQGFSSAIEKLSIRESHMKLISFFLTVIVCSHVMTCLFYFAAKYNDFSKDTWVFRYSYMDYSNLDSYIISMYWSYTTLSTVGYGDITPCTNIEIIMSLMWMVFGICFFSFTIGSLASMLTGVDNKEALLTTKLNYIDEFAKETNISKDLKNKLKVALRYSTDFEGYSWKNKEDIFNELPIRIRYEVTMVMHRQAAERIQFFSNKDPVFITAIIPLLTPVQLNKHEMLYIKNDVPEEIYFINKGKISYLYEDKHLVFCSFMDGSYLGDIEVVLETKRKYSALSIHDSNLLALNYEGINVIREEFPLIWKSLERVAKYRDALMSIAIEKAVKICEMKIDVKVDEIGYTDIKELYNEMITEEFENTGLGHRQQNEDNFMEKIVNRIAEFGNTIKDVNLKASLVCHKVEVIEKLLIKSNL